MVDERAFRHMLEIRRRTTLPAMITRRALILGMPVIFVAIAGSGCRRRSASGTNGALAPSDPVDSAFTACSHSCGLRSAKDRAAARSQPGAVLGDVVYCPVSGAVFRVGEQSPQRQSRDRTFYFCCEACAGWFTKHEADVLAQRGLG